MTDEVVTDYFGRPIGRKKKKGDKTIVTDYFGRPLGSADEDGTRDFVGKPESQDDIPDLLLKKKKKKR